MNKYLNWIGGLALASLFTLGGDLPGATNRSALAKPPAATTTQPRAKLIPQNQRGGQIKVAYIKTEDRLSLQLMEAYHKSRFFSKIGKVITAKINLPRDITLVIRDCGQVNAFYNSDDHSIVMCNELTKSNYQTLRRAGMDNDKAWQTAINSTIFSFYHESGHMLIHELNLPIVGKEEDIADQFSAYFLLNNDPTEGRSMSGEIVLAAARLFALSISDPSPELLMDEHSLNQQRFYNLVCTLYGSAPGTYEELVKKLDYSSSRLSSCRSESEQIANSWKRLLAPYTAKADRSW
jgi:Putative metallopeptidase